MSGVPPDRHSAEEEALGFPVDTLLHRHSATASQTPVQELDQRQLAPPSLPTQPTHHVALLSPLSFLARAEEAGPSSLPSDSAQPAQQAPDEPGPPLPSTDAESSHAAALSQEPISEERLVHYRREQGVSSHRPSAGIAGLWVPADPEERMARLQAQIEFYVSDANLGRDDFFRRLVLRAEAEPIELPLSVQVRGSPPSGCGWFPAEVFLHCPRARALARGQSEAVQSAVQQSSLFEFTSSVEWVRRVDLRDVPGIERLRAKLRSPDPECTVYMEHLPFGPATTVDDLLAVASEVGPVARVSIPHWPRGGALILPPPPSRLSQSSKAVEGWPAWDSDARAGGANARRRAHRQSLGPVWGGRHGVRAAKGFAFVEFESAQSAGRAIDMWGGRRSAPQPRKRPRALSSEMDGDKAKRVKLQQDNESDRGDVSSSSESDNEDPPVFEPPEVADWPPPRSRTFQDTVVAAVVAEAETSRRARAVPGDATALDSSGESLQLLTDPAITGVALAPDDMWGTGLESAVPTRATLEGGWGGEGVGIPGLVRSQVASWPSLRMPRGVSLRDAHGEAVTKAYARARRSTKDPGGEATPVPHGWGDSPEGWHEANSAHTRTDFSATDQWGAAHRIASFRPSSEPRRSGTPSRSEQPSVAPRGVSHVSDTWGLAPSVPRQDVDRDTSASAGPREAVMESRHPPARDAALALPPPVAEGTAVQEHKPAATEGTDGSVELETHPAPAVASSDPTTQWAAAVVVHSSTWTGQKQAVAQAMKDLVTRGRGCLVRVAGIVPWQVSFRELREALNEADVPIQFLDFPLSWENRHRQSAASSGPLIPATPCSSRADQDSPPVARPLMAPSTAIVRLASSEHAELMLRHFQECTPLRVRCLSGSEEPTMLQLRVEATAASFEKEYNVWISAQRARYRSKGRRK
jgi:hypothetical protein